MLEVQLVLPEPLPHQGSSTLCNKLILALPSLEATPTMLSLGPPLPHGEALRTLCVGNHPLAARKRVSSYSQAASLQRHKLRPRSARCSGA